MLGRANVRLALLKSELKAGGSTRPRSSRGGAGGGGGGAGGGGGGYAPLGSESAGYAGAADGACWAQVSTFSPSSRRTW